MVLLIDEEIIQTIFMILEKNDNTLDLDLNLNIIETDEKHAFHSSINERGMDFDHEEDDDRQNKTKTNNHRDKNNNHCQKSRMNHFDI